MKTVTLDEMRKKNRKRRHEAIRAVRKVNPDFSPGMRSYDRPRQNPKKQQLLKEMSEKEDDLQRNKS